MTSGPACVWFPFRKRTAIAFEIDETERTVMILRVFYGGQDYDAVMRDS